MKKPNRDPIPSVTTRLNRVPRLLNEFAFALSEHTSTELDSIGIAEGSVRLPHPYDLAPHEAQAIAGEIIHDIRSALDNLIYEASRRNNNNVEVEQTQFVCAGDEAFTVQSSRLVSSQQRVSRPMNISNDMTSNE